MDEVDRAARVVRPDRQQIRLEPVDLESLIPADHRARLVWEFVEGLDLSGLYGRIQAVEGHAGRPATDPAVLLALWLYATIEGVGSARRLADLCESHDAYRWLRGGVPVNAHTLSDFRSDNAEAFDRMLTESVAALLAGGAVRLRRVSQDGIRVRASAGASSFRRGKTLRRCLREAETQVRRLREQGDKGSPSGREAAAQERAARIRRERVERAQEQLAAIEREREERPHKRDEGRPPRASTTDPEARVMRMPDGGYRPAYNAHFTTDCETQVIVGVDVTNRGTDRGELGRALTALEARFGRRPTEALADAGFQALEDIQRLEQQGTRVYMPPSVPRRGDRSQFRPLPTDTPEMARWRRRMGRAPAKEVYKHRAATSECVNARHRQRGLWQFLVRGKEKVRAVLLLQALAHNLMREVALQPA
jgi:transposase